MQLLIKTLTYFFDPLPSSSFQYQTVLIVIGGIILSLSVGLRIVLKKSKENKIFKKLFRSLPGKLQSVAICIGIYVLARYEKIPYISMRIMNYIILLAFCYLIFSTVRTYKTIYPELKKRHDEQLKLNKYLPKSKKKG